MDWGRMFFSAYGRIGRGDFWITFLILFAAAILIGWFPLVGLFLIYSRVCIQTKRLHDMGRSGWLQTVPIVCWAAVMMFTLYFIIGAVIAGSVGGIGSGFGIAVGGLTLGAAWMTACLIDFGFLLWIGLSEGSMDDNQYGPARFDRGPTFFANA